MASLGIIEPPVCEWKEPRDDDALNPAKISADVDKDDDISGPEATKSGAVEDAAEPEATKSGAFSKSKSNSSSNSSGTCPGNLSTPQIVLAMAELHIDYDNDYEEEMPAPSERFIEADESDDDGYDRYGGYNEYGERDRGYYYRDGRYERKVSPMTSPIISPVYA